MSLFHWEEGRQGTGYRKLTLFRGHRFLPFDCYLIDYPVGSSVPTHTDPVEGKRHFRLNILLMGEDVYGGKSLFKTSSLFARDTSSLLSIVCRALRPHITFFRPDIMPHSVSTVSKRRLVFSIGWAIK